MAGMTVDYSSQDQEGPQDVGQEYASMPDGNQMAAQRNAADMNRMQQTMRQRLGITRP